jgi:predicted Zn-dependent protease
MGGFFYNLGKMVGPKLRQARWMFHSLAGSEADAIQAEHAVGLDLAVAFVQQNQIDPDPAVQQQLDDIGRRLAACVKGPQRRFSFRLVRANEYNAFAFPGGFIFITRPLLELADFHPDETAFILGHEMGHVIKRHAIDRLMASSLIRTTVSRLPVGGVLGAPIIHMATALLSQGYSQDSELEADSLGVKLARAAGFDGAAAVVALNRLRTIPSEAWALSTYLSSHPPVDVRIRAIDRLLKS